MSIKPEELKGYLFNGLKVLDEEICEIFEVCTYNPDSEKWLLYDNIDGSVIEYSRDLAKPILLPLSDLTKEIEHKGERFTPVLKLIEELERYGKWVDIAPTIDYSIEIVNKKFGKCIKVTKCDKWVLYISLREPQRLDYFLIQKLLEWHFDLHNWIEKGLAININTIKN